MINKSNNLPSFVKETNLPNIVDKLTDAKNIKISNNKYGNRVQTVIDEIVEKADDVTKAIKQEVVNNSYSFKVGTGDVDVSADVEDGFGEVGVKGVTYQNLYPQLNTKNYYDKYGAIQFDRDIIKFTANGSYQNIFLKKEALIVKPSTTYTLIIDILKNTIVNEQNDVMFLFLETSKESNQLSYFNEKIRLNKNNGIGRYEFVVTTKSDFSVSSYATRCFLNIKATSGELWIKYCILEGDHTNNNNLPSHFEGIVGVGDKSKNLFNKDNIKQTVLNLGAVDSNCSEAVSQLRCSLRKISCKPNTKYTIKSDKEINAAIGSIGNNNIALGDSSWRNIYNSYTYTTPSDAIELAVNIAKTDNTNIDIDYVKNFNIQIEEGETATTYEPHHDGHKIEVLSQGKNLWSRKLSDYDGISRKDSNSICVIADNYIEWQSYSDNYSPSMSYHFYVEPNTEYTMSYTERSNGIEIIVSDGHIGNIYNSSKVITSSTTGSQRTFTSKSNKITFRISNLGSTGVVKISGIQLEKGSTKSSYEPYVSDKTQILLDEPLMRLPNGVADEITRDGKLIRRVDKVILDGSRRWNLGTTSSGWKYGDTLPFYHYPDKADMDEKNNGYSLTDRFQTSIGATIVGSDVESFSLGHSNYITIRLNKSRLATEDAKGFIKWLQQNPTTVYYELETPIITDIIPPSLRIFKDGHLTFNTLVAPESNHVVQLNKSGQIQNAIKESQSLDNRINVLENNYDNLMLSTISRLNDLELNYTLK